MSPEQSMVKAFHEKYGHYVSASPSHLPNDKLITLRVRLMEEELSEVKEALFDGTLVQIAKELSDLLYVVYGTAVSFGIDLEPIFAEVHASNMTKGTEKNEFGKTMKGPAYREADIEPILCEQIMSKGGSIHG